MALSLLTKVKVKPPHPFIRLFLSKKRLQQFDREGLIVHEEVGKYSGQPLYTVLFYAGGGSSHFEDELIVLDS